MPTASDRPLPEPPASAVGAPPNELPAYTPVLHDGHVTLYAGDCLELLRSDTLGYPHALGYAPPLIADNSIDAIVTDPPYGLEFMGKQWDAPWKDERTDKRGIIDPAQWGGRQDGNGGNAFSRSRVRTAAAHYRDDPAAIGHRFGAWCHSWAQECLRVLKPGGHLLAFGGTRTYHRLAAGIEDAGFELRDAIAWLYGQGFPKSLDVAKAIDKAAGAEREVLGQRTDGRYAYGFSDAAKKALGTVVAAECTTGFSGAMGQITAPATPEAASWQGWGTALKPGFEPIVLARKPLIGTVAANVLTHGTGALNIARTRVPYHLPVEAAGADGHDRSDQIEPPPGSTALQGRWPANVALTHAADCEPLGWHTVTSTGHHPARRGAGGISTSGHLGQSQLPERRDRRDRTARWRCAPTCPIDQLDNPSVAPSGRACSARPARPRQRRPDGGPSRFFPAFVWQPKAPPAERPRLGSIAHPTVKPLTLMRWLVQLVTPPDGVVLDPFLGSGTTAEACLLEGFKCIGIERDASYLQLVKVRLGRQDPTAAEQARADPARPGPQTA